MRYKNRKQYFWGSPHRPIGLGRNGTIGWVLIIGRFSFGLNHNKVTKKYPRWKAYGPIAVLDRHASLRPPTLASWHTGGGVTVSLHSPIKADP